MDPNRIGIEQYKTTETIPVGPAYRTFDSLTVSTDVERLIGLGSSASTHAFITVESAAVRFRVDGGDPTAAIGHVLEPGDALTLDNKVQIQAFRAIRRDGIDATLRISQGY